MSRSWHGGEARSYCYQKVSRSDVIREVAEDGQCSAAPLSDLAAAGLIQNESRLPDISRVLQVCTLVRLQEFVQRCTERFVQCGSSIQSRASMTDQPPIFVLLFCVGRISGAQRSCRGRPSGFRTIQDEPDISSVFPICTRVRLQEYVQRCTERFVQNGAGAATSRVLDFGNLPPPHLGTVLHLRVLINHPAMSAIGKPDIEPTPPNDRPLTPSGIRKRSRDLSIGLSH